MATGLPPILGYHPEIQVEKEGERHVLKLTVKDYETDDKILLDLATEFKVDTVGEVVEKLSAGELSLHVQKASVEKVGGVVPHKAGQKVWAWSEKLSKPL